MKNMKLKYILIALALSVVIIACVVLPIVLKKDDKPAPSDDTPQTYNLSMSFAGDMYSYTNLAKSTSGTVAGTNVYEVLEETLNEVVFYVETGNNDILSPIAENTNLTIKLYISSFNDATSVDIKVNDTTATTSTEEVGDYIVFTLTHTITSNTTITVTGDLEPMM